MRILYWGQWMGKKSTLRMILVKKVDQYILYNINKIWNAPTFDNSNKRASEQY